MINPDQSQTSKDPQFGKKELNYIIFVPVRSNATIFDFTPQQTKRFKNIVTENVVT